MLTSIMVLIRHSQWNHSTKVVLNGQQGNSAFPIDSPAPGTLRENIVDAAWYSLALELPYRRAEGRAQSGKPPLRGLSKAKARRGDS